MLSLLHIIVLGTMKVKRESKVPMHGYRQWIKGRSLLDSFCLSKSFSDRLSPNLHCELLV